MQTNAYVLLPKSIQSIWINQCLPYLRQYKCCIIPRSQEWRRGAKNHTAEPIIIPRSQISCRGAIIYLPRNLLHGAELFCPYRGTKYPTAEPFYIYRGTNTTARRICVPLGFSNKHQNSLGHFRLLAIFSKCKKYWSTSFSWKGGTNRMNLVTSNLHSESVWLTLLSVSNFLSSKLFCNSSFFNSISLSLSRSLSLSSLSSLSRSLSRSFSLSSLSHSQAF